MAFIGREEEQRIIRDLLRKETYQGCVVYGRRRMGKTCLLKHCLEGVGKPVVFFQCKQTSEAVNAELLDNLIADVLGIKNFGTKDFMSSVEYLFRYAAEKEVVLVIDEYPYLRDAIEGCDSFLQEIIDRHEGSTHLKLFLCGSSIGIMQGILSGDHPLYMRFQQAILLKQMDYFDSSLFYPGFALEDKVRLYAAFGGVPYYNAQIDPRLSARENIIRILSGQNAGIEEYLEVYLRAELRKVANAYAVFNAIACGAFHYSDILAKSKIGVSSALTAILQKLMRMDLVQYVAPINDKGNKQKAGYRIADNSIRFYFRYVYRHSSLHSITSDEAFFDRFVEGDFEAGFVPSAFEEIVKQYLIRGNRKGMWDPLFTDIGTYWYDSPAERKNGQFDVVGRREDGYVFFECKFTKEPIDDALVAEEVGQVEKTTLRACQYGFASRSGFRLTGEYPYIFLTLEDLYK